MRRVLLGTLAAASVAALVLVGHNSTRAADHLDSPSVAGACDISDLYSWMTPDASDLVLVMNINAAALSNECQYVFHVGSAAAFGQATTNTMILCQYDNELTCWVGNAGETGGGAYQARVSGALETTLEDGGLKVFAGQRDDPFFFNGEGFNTAVETVRSAAPTLTPNEYGCPNVDAATSTALVTALSSGGAAEDSFAGLNTSSIVVEVDKTLVNSGGDILAVWASSRQRN